MELENIIDIELDNICETGPQGLSAYEVYLKNGGTLSETEWLESLKGDVGEQGPQGPQGEKGDTGPQGPEGPEGPQGERGPQGIQGEIGPEGPQGIQGEPGPTYTAGDNITIDENNVISASGVNTPEFFIDIPSVSINTSNRYETYTLSDDFNSQLTTIINNIFGKYQRFTVMFLVNFVLAKFKPSVMSYSDGRGTPTLGGHPSQINLYAVIDSNTATSATGAEPVMFGAYIPLTLTIYLSWDGNIALVTKSTFKMFGYSGTIPSIDYMRGKTLFKDNATSFTPTKDYHPATKKYVDDNKYALPIASADTLGGIKLGEGLSADENGVVSASGNTLTCLEDKNVFVLSLDKNKNSNVNTLTYASGCNDSEICGYFSEILTNIMPKKSGILILTLLNYGADSTHQNSYVFNWYYGSNKFYGLVHDYFGVQINYLEFTYTTTDNVVNVSKVYLKSDVIKTNKAPTNNDHLTNKKYVDDKPTTYTGYDATKTQVLKNVNGTLTWVDEV